MKILLLLLLPLCTIAQDIPKNANIITVKGVSFNQVVNNLLDSGFKIDKMDKEFQYVKTEYRDLCGDCLPKLLINVRVKDSVATITGQWKSTANILGLSTAKEDAYLFDIKNERDKVPRMCFAVMNNFAKALNGEVSYIKQ